jgi:hypothetical protein
LAITSSSYCSRPIGQTAPEARDGAIFDFMGARAEWVSGSLVLHFGGSTVKRHCHQGSAHNRAPSWR